jgi:23S rRNA (uracil747-C5)-methyltransferase
MTSETSKQSPCSYFAKKICRSCSLLDQSYAQTLASKREKLISLFSDFPGVSPAKIHAWPEKVKEIFPFRNKAKMVVSGSVKNPCLGILDPQGRGIDLSDCPLYFPLTTRLMASLPTFIREQGLVPYDIFKRTGNLKHIIIHESHETGELMLRFVAKDKTLIPAIQAGQAALQARFPEIKVMSVNIQSEPKAIIEGPEEIFLTACSTLEHPLGNIALTIGPQSFFQTNSAVALELYQQVQTLVRELGVKTLCDLYCGVGGLAFFAAKVEKVEEVLGIEFSEASVHYAIKSRENLKIGKPMHFLQGDVEVLLQTHPLLRERPQLLRELILVNPPRAGLRENVRQFIREQAPQHILYSSCNPQTLKRDLNDWIDRYTIELIRPFDMFPFTEHLEVLVWMRKK